MTKDELIEKVQEKNWVFGIKEWSEFARNPQTKEDIILRAICGTEVGSKIIKNELNMKSIDCLCYTYLCSTQYMDEDLIKELMFISSPLFNLDTYRPEFIEIGFRFIKDKKSNIDDLIEDFNEEQLMILENIKLLAKYNVLREKIDWRAVYRNPKIDTSKDFYKNNKEYIQRVSKLENL